MSSEVTVSQNVREEKGFTFTWFIHNFSHCSLEENKVFSSPNFTCKSLGNAKWNLCLYPKGNYAPGFISCNLNRLSGTFHTFNFTFSVRKANGQYKEVLGEAEFLYNHSGSKNCDEFLSLSKLEGKDTYLTNDTLTVRCHLWKKDEDNSPPEDCVVHTEIKVTQIDYIWTLNEVTNLSDDHIIDHNSEVPIDSENVPSLKIHILGQGSHGSDDLHFGIETPALANDVFLTSVVCMLKENGRVAHTVRDERWLKYKEKSKIQDFPFISKRKLYLYLINNTMTLKCQFYFSGGDHVVKSIEYRRTDEPELKSESCFLEDGHEIWNRNLQKFYSGETFGHFKDITLRTATRDFPAHRSTLVAHSEVFLAMFEHEMKEQSSGVVQIEDLEADTVSRMLSFVYTGAVGDLDFAIAQKLYYAADKYGITSLLNICSEFLMSRIDLGNVCDILLLADKHQDESLKSCAKLFIFEHAREFLNLEDWKNVKEENARLTIEIIEWLLNNKLKL